MNFPANLRYTKDHEWVSLEGNVATIGITEFAQRELGDIVYVEVDTIGKQLGAGDVFGTVEAVKTVSDLFMPIKGEVLEVNQKAIEAPQLINTDPYGDGWLIKIRALSESEKEKLLTANEYKKLIGA